jgi:glycosyltransferase involved in cell wall biosynthesis
MKIAIDISQIVYSGTGVAKYTKELVKNLIRIDSENNYILLGFTFRKKQILKEFSDEIASNKKNITVKLFPFPISTVSRIWNDYHVINVETLIGKIDVFHSSDWIQPPSFAKKVTTIHDMVVYKYPELSHPLIVATHKKRLVHVKNECDAVITDSEASKEDLINILKFDERKIEVISPGISGQFIPATNEEKTILQRKYSLNNDYVLAVGTIEPRKNLKSVISAYEKFTRHSLISSRKKGMDLVIAGNSGWESDLKNNEHIRFLGFVPDIDMRALYSAADLFVYPSFYEGFGFPVLEAMACGCPVITSDRGSLKEVAKDAALLVDPYSTDDLSHKMVQLIIDLKLKSEMIKKGLINVEKYTWEKTAKKTLSVYKKIHENT